MVEPVRAGEALANEITGTLNDDDHVALWWLGQSGFVMRWRELNLVIDPYLSDALAHRRAGAPTTYERLMAPPLAPAEVSWCDILVITHDHGDHLDPQTVQGILKASPTALVVLPAPLADYAADHLGVKDESLVPIADGQVFEHEELAIHALPAAHERLEPDDDGSLPCLGYVVVAGPTTVYFAGDTVPYRDQVERVAAHHPQVAIVPINGRDARRKALGIAGNLTVAEAARLAAGAGADVVVPCHYGMFAVDDGDVEAFRAHVAQYHPSLRVETPRLGERWIYPGEGA